MTRAPDTALTFDEAQSQQQHVFALRETSRRELVDERPVHLLVEIKVKGVERPVGIAEARERVPAVKQAILSAPEFVSDQADTRSIER